MAFDNAEISTGGLMPRATIHQLVAAKAQALDAYLGAWDALTLARGLAGQAAPSGRSGELPYLAAGSPYGRTHRAHETREQYAAAVARALDQDVWDHVIKATSLDKLMDRQERDAFRAALSNDPPPATVENIAATVERLVGDSDMIFKRGIATAFAQLDRRFRSHDGFKVGARIVLSRAFSEFGAWNHYQRHDDTMIDVERAFAQLDGKPQPERMGGIVGAVDSNRNRQGLRLQAFEAESDYFRVRVFGNGNAHVWFKRSDLVAKINQLLADYYGANLGAGPDAAEKRHAYSTVPAKNMGWFPTPERVAERVLDEAGVYCPRTHSGDYPKLRVLEPSAGLGAIASKAVARGHQVTCVELNPGRAAELATGARYARVLASDFLALRPADLGARFDRIVMNPPFDRGQDVDHVTHALQFLEEGGRLCAVMAAGVEFREDAKTSDFRAMVESRGGRFVDLPPGSFAESGTNVNTVLCVVGGRRS